MAAPGIKDVATRAGVSVGTVSNVLNRPDARQRPHPARVLDAIAALGFVRNESARHLRNGHSRTLAYLAARPAEPVLHRRRPRGRGRRPRGRARALPLQQRGGRGPRGRVPRHPARAAGARRPHHAGRQRRPSGCARMPDLGRPRRARRPGARATRRAWCSVSVDDVEGGDLAVTPPARARAHPDRLRRRPATRSCRSTDRRRGALRALDRAGVARRRARRARDRRAHRRRGPAGGAAASSACPPRRRPTAVFCANDLLAIGFLQQMIQHGVDVPGDMAIVGYDDIEFAAAAAVPLSSVRASRGTSWAGGRASCCSRRPTPGRRAAAAAHVHQQVEFTPELVVRASSGRRAARRGA